MADGGTSDRHKNSLSYVETEANTPTDGQFTALWATNGQIVTVFGACPACGGRTATEFSPGIAGTKGFRRSEPRSRTLPSPLTIFCECGHAHADRPADALDKGCGRFWRVFLPEDQRQSPSVRPTGTTPAPTTP